MPFYPLPAPQILLQLRCVPQKQLDSTSPPSRSDNSSLKPLLVRTEADSWVDEPWGRVSAPGIHAHVKLESRPDRAAGGGGNPKLARWAGGAYGEIAAGLQATMLEFVPYRTLCLSACAAADS
nr:hypothetical protein CFP56_13311 [Quercus suber]